MVVSRAASRRAFCRVQRRPLTRGRVDPDREAMAAGCKPRVHVLDKLLACLRQPFQKQAPPELLPPSVLTPVIPSAKAFMMSESAQVRVGRGGAAPDEVRSAVSAPPALLRCRPPCGSCEPPRCSSSRVPGVPAGVRLVPVPRCCNRCWAMFARRV